MVIVWCFFSFVDRIDDGNLFNPHSGFLIQEQKEEKLNESFH